MILSCLNTFPMYILLLFCYLNYSVYFGLTLVDVFSPPSIFTTTVTVILVYLNYSVNPSLYCWRDRQIRDAVQQLFWG